ncbi:MAG TPA: helix-turn-helix domain-containing protein, partial [Nocardioides sp.]|nr:helix-turn-helix domain-containing protein [Nocardioides sp.]
MSTEPTQEAAAPGGGTAARRRLREAEIISATRRLFDERGVRDAQIEDIARAVGINRAIIYRHFTSKEELFSLTLVQYLDELRIALEDAAETTSEPRAQLVRLVEAFVEYGLGHPAFVDCAQSIMRRPGGDLLEEVSESAMYRLGQAIGGCLSVL